MNTDPGFGSAETPRGISVGESWTRPVAVGDLPLISAEHEEAHYYATFLDLSQSGINEPMLAYVGTIWRSYLPGTTLRPFDPDHSYHIAEGEHTLSRRVERMQEYDTLAPNSHGAEVFEVVLPWGHMLSKGLITDDGSMRMDPRLASVLARLRVMVSYPSSDTTPGGSLVSEPNQFAFVCVPPSCTFDAWRPTDHFPLPVANAAVVGTGTFGSIKQPGYQLAIPPSELANCTIRFKLAPEAPPAE